MTVAIVGAGASGTLTATHLLRAGGRQRLVLHESGSTVARGAAYGTTDDRHLLNVRAIDMSGLPDEQRHLLAWAERSGEPVHEHAFMPRRRYGAYLTDLLASSASAAQGRLEIRHDAITDLARVPGGFEVRTADGGHQVTTVVLAHGNLRPRDLAVDGAPLPDAPWHVAVPWRPGALEHLSPTATVVLVGSGLTAVDVAVTLLSDAPSRRVVMVSRHGELPRRHTVFPVARWVTAVPSGPLTAAGLADHVRDQVRCAAAEGIGWRSVVEGLRPHTASLWQRLDPCERRRFLAVHAREWEVRRHRMAPQIAQLLDGWRAEGRLCVLAGTLTSLEDLGGRCLVGLPTGPVDVDAVVNCTGPLTDVTQSRDPLIASLLARGLLRPDPLRLGIDCTPCGEVVGRGGEVVPGLFVVGPPRKGTLYETTAVPEIRGQAAALAERLG